VIHVKSKSIKQIVEIYSNLIKELKERGVLRSNNFLGDIGEYLAVELLNERFPELQLSLEPPVTRNYDAISITTNKTYSIKSMTVNQTSIIDRVNNNQNNNQLQKLFDNLVLVKFDRDYVLEQVYIASWDKFIDYRHWHATMNGWDLILTMRFKNDDEVIKIL
jgi:hypothetical protein